MAVGNCAYNFYYSIFLFVYFEGPLLVRTLLLMCANCSNQALSSRLPGDGAEPSDSKEAKLDG